GALDGQVYQAGTLSGNPVAMRAGWETLCLVEQPGFYEDLFAKTERLVQKIQKTIAKTQAKACVQYVGSMLTLFLGVEQVRNKQEAASVNEKQFAELFRFLLEKGIYIPPASQEAWFLSSSHTEEHIDYTAEAVSEFIEKYL
ncbi:MAG TPA: aspartate aminotransferase family protein, partial [Parachlamydiales bacterium]|nr:aspartate aminotransferase family protein [Parachlamydiales bacterium]